MEQISTYGLYADSPRRFRLAQIENLALDMDDFGCEERHGVQNLKTMVVRYANWNTIVDPVLAWKSWSIALLPCIPRGPSHYVVGILLRGWHQNASRNMRYAFKGEVFSCLVRGEHVIEALQESVKIIPRENHPLQQLVDHTKRDRTLRVKMEDMEYYPFRILQPVEWVQAPSHRDIFSMFTGPTSSIIILKFQHPGAIWSVLVGFTLYEVTPEDGRKVHRCVIQVEPSSTSTDLLLKNIQKEIELPHFDTRLRACARGSCKHDCLRITVETTTVFNQAMTTLTLAKSNPGSPSTSSSPAVCLP